VNPEQHVTAPEDRIPFSSKIIYGLGGFVNNILAAAIGGMVIVLNLGLGMNPALVGLLGAIPRLTDAITDPLMGFISDHTRSRWGRRRPYIFVGAIVSGLVFMLLWQLPAGKSESFYFWVFLGGSMIFFLGYTIFATPWVALGYELTPDYHERTRVMGVQNFISQLAYLVSPWFLWFMQLSLFENLMQGASYLAIAIGTLVLFVGILPALFLRERYTAVAQVELADHDERPAAGIGVALARNVRNFMNGFLMTVRFSPFLKLCGATFLVFNGFMLISSFQFYVIIYYVFAGDQALGAEYAGWSGTLSAVSTFVVISLVTWLATVVGKRRAFFFSTGISIVGYGLKWICYNPEVPWLLLLPAPFMAFGLGGLFTLMGSMMADVCDLDELQSGERREGMFGSIFWWVVKLGMAAAIAGGGFLLNATGFDVALGGAQPESTIYLLRVFDVLIPMICSALAIWIIYLYPITEAKALELRRELESRRGKVQ
jgi:GPH family glycoside/pentoside/hexuronide:cation symporter